ncbi:hypothetical protein AVENLUH13518_02183 [Acinetobacter venetianus]|uniref:Uncharacterized protein n=1 Tax=Acinetobacter venetianus TaxID=52133 RepID=A0A150HT14_9GAMM|nr:hypothetical protein AVENLUH7437_02545 [Acinetobacter venetianus]KXZ69930.1 hypothetical protein AVENLUH13518_02183 [Acinetobacter venetianus]
MFMDKKHIVPAKQTSKQRLGWVLLVLGCAVLLKRDSRQPKNDTFSAPSKGA